MATGDLADARTPAVFVFNPFAEGFIAHGKSFTPRTHQALLAGDLANLPQFLCEPHDIVLLPQRPAQDFLASLETAGFATPEFVEIGSGRVLPADRLLQRTFRALRPWAWGPDSVRLLKPLFSCVAGSAQHFNAKIAELYSKAWSARFLRDILARARANRSPAHAWLCSEEDAGVAVNSFTDALEAIALIRARGHQRVVVKQSYGVAGSNSLRLWEPGLLATQQQWLTKTAEQGVLVVEPWLEREVDFSIQLEMGLGGLELRGYTGLMSDRRGQFLANWAEPDYTHGPPSRAVALLGENLDAVRELQPFFQELFATLETDLNAVGFNGPISIDSFVFRDRHGRARLKPVVEINPRYTMGRVTIELMKHAVPGRTGLFRLVTLAQARAAGHDSLASYARSLKESTPPQLALQPPRRLEAGAVCLNDPRQARVCVATFAVASNFDPELLCLQNPQPQGD